MIAADRVSVIAAARPYIPLAAPPDGAMTATDRALLGHGYSGILAASPVPFLSLRWALAVARRPAMTIAPQPVLAIV